MGSGQGWPEAIAQRRAAPLTRPCRQAHAPASGRRRGGTYPRSRYRGCVAERNDDLMDEVVGATTGLVPFGGILGPFVRRMSRAVREEHARRQSVALRSAERRSGLSREDLEEHIASDPDLMPLAVRVLYAAGSTGDEKLLKLLGAALGDAASGADEEAALVVGVLSALTPSHLKVMETLSGEPPPPDEPEGSVGRWWLATVRSESGLSAHVVNLCVSELESRGVVRTGETYRGDDCSLTPLGSTMLEVLRDLNREARAQ